MAQRGPEERNWLDDVYTAIIAAFDHDTDGVIAALTTGLRNGMRAPWAFMDPAFDDIRDDRRFIALQEELDEILAEEREKVLHLICFNNAVPDEWQPMPETCHPKSQ